MNCYRCGKWMNALCKNCQNKEADKEELNKLRNEVVELRTKINLLEKELK